MKCLILAGGFGTRMYPLTRNVPKALLEHNGKPVLNHIIDCIPPHIDVYISTNKKFELDFYHWQGTINRKTEICVEQDVLSEEHKKGAVGSLHYWITSYSIKEPLLVIASDNYFEFSLGDFIKSFDGENAVVAVYDIGDRSKAKQFGVVRLEGSRIVEFQEKPAVPQTSLIATAIYVLPPRLFPLLSKYCAEGKKDNLGGFIAYLTEKDTVYAYTFKEIWLDIGVQIENG